MTALLAMALVAASALAQLAIEANIGSSAGVPLLPVAILGAWARTRPSFEGWVAVPPAALLLGAASDERAGWFLLALLPVPLLASVTHRGGPGRALAAAAAAAGVGACLYLWAFTVVDGRATLGLDEARTIAGAAAWTALGALLLTACLLPFRPRERGLFA